MISLGYYADWQDSLPPAKVPYPRYTHLNHAFALLDSKGNLTAPRRATEFCRRAKAAKTVPLVAIGGPGARKPDTTPPSPTASPLWPTGHSRSAGPRRSSCWASPPTGWKRLRDQAEEVPYLVSPDGKELISFDDPESIRRKATLARAAGLPGFFFWEISEDDGTLVTAAQKAWR